MRPASPPVTPARTVPARYVRLTGPLGDLSEVSVWDTTPPGNAASPSRTAPALIALAALLAAAVLTAASARARR